MGFNRMCVMALSTFVSFPNIMFEQHQIVWLEMYFMCEEIHKEKPWYYSSDWLECQSAMVNLLQKEIINCVTTFPLISHIFLSSSHRLHHNYIVGKLLSRNVHLQPWVHARERNLTFFPILCKSCGECVEGVKSITNQSCKWKVIPVSLNINIINNDIFFYTI